MALARTLVTDPDCLLLDEPLSSLDTPTKAEIRRLLREVNKGDDASHKRQTIIHVTHDYEEAIALADRVAVFEDGEITQLGKPSEIFRHPKSDFIAKFVGIKNFYRGRLCKDSSEKNVFSIEKNDKVFYVSDIGYTGVGCLILRSEDITISNTFNESSARNSFEGKIIDIETVRNGIEVTVDIGKLEISALITEASLKNLNLYNSKKVFASFKANAPKFIQN